MTPRSRISPKRPAPGADMVICTDVMEHIPVENVQKVLEDIQGLAPHAYFQHLVPRGA